MRVSFIVTLALTCCLARGQNSAAEESASKLAGQLYPELKVDFKGKFKPIEPGSNIVSYIGEECFVSANGGGEVLLFKLHEKITELDKSNPAISQELATQRGRDILTMLKEKEYLEPYHIASPQRDELEHLTVPPRYHLTFSAKKNGYPVDGAFLSLEIRARDGKLLGYARSPEWTYANPVINKSEAEMKSLAVLRDGGTEADYYCEKAYRPQSVSEGGEHSPSRLMVLCYKVMKRSGGVSFIARTDNGEMLHVGGVIGKPNANKSEMADKAQAKKAAVSSVNEEDAGVQSGPLVIGGLVLLGIGVAAGKHLGRSR